MKAAPVVHICGWPGSGKRTIGKALCRRIGGRLIDNHLILDAAAALFKRGTRESSDLRETLRQVLYDAARTLPAEVPLILTDALSDSATDRPLIEPTLELARDRRARLVPIVLTVEIAENRRRLLDPARKDTGKLTDPAILDDLRRCHRLLHLEGAGTLDVTALSAEAAAIRIEAMLDA
ncbi:MAG: AAA family ATPase [Jannaschia sp.]